MKLTRLTKLAMTGAIALTFGLSAPSANAQTTENVTASATVQNGFTVAEVNGLLFGTVGFFLDGTNNVEYALATDDSAVFTPAGGTSNMASIVGGQAAELTVQGPIATDINMVIPSATIVQPTDGTTAFILDSFTYDDQAAAPNAGVVAFDTPVTVTLDAANTDENVLIGASLTADGTLTYADGTYNGTFDVTFQY